MSTTLASLMIGILLYAYGVPAIAANTGNGAQNSGTSQQTQQQTTVANQGTTQQIQSQTQVQTQTMINSPTGIQVQNQNQIQTQNQGESQSLQVATQEQESLDTQKRSVQPTSGKQSVLLSVEDATKNTEDILNVSMVKGSPGEKIQEVVKSQAAAQTEIAVEIQKLDSRKGFVKTLIGPDFKALKTLTQQMEQNQLRIQELEQLKNQLVSQSDVIMVQEAIQAFVDQNTALQDKIVSEEKNGSMFGWLLKLFI